MTDTPFGAIQIDADASTSADDIRIQRMLEMSPDFDAPATSAAPVPLTLEPAPVAKSKKWSDRLTHISRRTILLGAGVALLVLFALLIGWVMGSANQPKTAAWHTSPQYEKMYLAMVADKYARTGDLAQVQRDLAGASPAEVARILDSLQRETTDTTRRQRLAALADTVRPPVTQTSYVPLLINQPVFLLSLFFSLTPMLVALGLVIGPYVRQQLRATEGKNMPAGQTGGVVTGDTLPETDGAPIDPNAPVVGAPDMVEQTPEAGGAAPATPTEEEQKKKEEEEEEEEQQQEQDGGLGDLASLFEEEDTSLAALENFCKGLPDVNVDVLIANAKETTKSLKEAIARKR